MAEQGRIEVRRYELPVPEWCRVRWASPQARMVWQGRLREISAEWAAAERASVGRFRSATIQFVPPETLPEYSMRAAREGLVLLVLDAQRSTGAPYRAAGGDGDGALEYRVALVTPQAAGLLAEAWRQRDDETLGRLLGYPACCRNAFRRWWGDWIDTTWPMVRAVASGHEVVVSGSVEANILLRWAGVRYVPHLPCSFTCRATAEMGRRFRALLSEQVQDWMDQMLDGPVQWSAWHGIAEIETPVLSVSAKTDATAERLVVRRKGRRYPDGGAAGNRFPYLRHVGDPALNGFSSLSAMYDAHTVVAGVAGRVVSCLDLGCGDGTLAARIGSRAVGVEHDAERAKAARRVCDRVIEGRIADLAWEDEHYSVGLLMPGRLLEIEDQQERAAVVDALARCCDRVVVYRYGDWPPLRQLCTDAGLAGKLDRVVAARTVEAGEWVMP